MLTVMQQMMSSDHLVRSQPKFGGGSASKRHLNSNFPLCIPNQCWNARSVFCVCVFRGGALSYVTEWMNEVKLRNLLLSMCCISEVSSPPKKKAIQSKMNSASDILPLELLTSYAHFSFRMLNWPFISVNVQLTLIFWFEQKIQWQDWKTKSRHWWHAP